MRETPGISEFPSLPHGPDGSHLAWGVDGPFQPQVQEAGGLHLVCLLLSWVLAAWPTVEREVLEPQRGSVSHHFIMSASAKGGRKAASAMYLPTCVNFHRTWA